MKKSIALLVSFFLTISLCFTQELAVLDELIDKTYQKLQQHESISYEVFYKNKAYWSLDTTESAAHCDVIRNEADTFFPAYYWVSIDNDETKADNGEIHSQPEIVYIYNGKDLLTKYKSYNWENVNLTDPKKAGVLPNTYTVNFHFINPDWFKKLALEATKYEKQVMDEQEYWHIIVEKKPTDKYRDQVIEFWVSANDYSIHKVIEQYQYQNYDGFQYQEWNFTIDGYDNFTLDELHARSIEIQTANNLYNYLLFKKDDNPLIAEGASIPFFIGWNILERREVAITEYSDAPIVLYFWDAGGMSQKSLTYIDNLSTIYAPYGIVFIGLVAEKSNQPLYPNNISEDKKKLLEETAKKLLEKIGTTSSEADARKNTSEDIFKSMLDLEIGFTNLLVPTTVFEEFGTIGYPEIIIIDKAGNIKRTLAGLNDLNKTELEKSLELLVK